MHRPWQIWLLFFLCLAVVGPALWWLTLKAWELDEAEAAARLEAEQSRAEAEVARDDAEAAREQAEAARRRAELEEDISRALWRMDTWLTPVIAQEAARPVLRLSRYSRRQRGGAFGERKGRRRRERSRQARSRSKARRRPRCRRWSSIRRSTYC